MDRWRRWWATYRREVLKLLLPVTLLAVVFAPLGATKYQDSTGDSYLHSVAMVFLVVAGMGLLFVVVAVVWGFLEDRTPLDARTRGSDQS